MAATTSETPLTPDELTAIDAYWRAANYLSIGQIYLLDNPLLREPLQLEQIKKRLLGHWGTSPGLNFIYAHMNRLIRKRDIDAIFIAGPGHGGPAVVANAYLEGTYTERYPHITQDEAGLRKLFRQFSFPGGIPSHASPDAPGSIHEGGELGYSLLHAFGAAFDNPELFVCCVIGDGEAETGALATSWHGNKFLNPARDGAVLPVLHLNGYKLSGPTVLARIPEEELCSLLRGYGYEPIVVGGEDPPVVHRLFAEALERAYLRIRAIQDEARNRGFTERAAWPAIVLRTPKGWTGPKIVDGLQIEGTQRAHQIPIGDFEKHPEHLAQFESWMRSYRPQELFDAAGTLRPELAALAPQGGRRMSANPNANGGELLRPLRVPDFRTYALPVRAPGSDLGEATRTLGAFVRDLLRDNPHTMRLFAPDESASNRLEAVFEVTERCSTARVLPGDDRVSPDGRVMEILSEHACQGWLEGYLLTGRHGLFTSYEAFVHVIDSMFNQHAKWIEACKAIPWRLPIASLNYLITSHVWRQDHNGFTHQDPGFLDIVMNKSGSITRVYLPPDANTLLSTVDHAMRSSNYINVIVAGKQPEPQWLDIDAAIVHCSEGLGIWEWASNDDGVEPDVVMACAGDVPTLETLAAVDLLRTHVPEMRIRVVNVVDLMRLEAHEKHPHGLTDAQFDALFTTDKPVVFAFHGYPGLIHRLTYRRANHANFHVHGYQERGTTTTPFDMTVLNELDRFHLAGDAIARVAALRERAAHVQQLLRDKLVEHHRYILEHGEDLPEIRDWRWPQSVRS
ncbi:MAG: phosphoketolase family protein [Candidatus Baltobacteraceae bacterium]